MGTGTLQTDAQKYETNQVHYLRKRVTYNETGIATGVSMGKVPAGSMILDAGARIETGFNSAGTNRLVIGTNSSSYNNIMTSTVAAASTTGGKKSTIGAALSFTQDTEVFAKYTAATGTAASAGVATLVVAYVPGRVAGQA
jgi:hypothetical protein